VTASTHERHRRRGRSPHSSSSLSESLGTRRIGGVRWRLTRRTLAGRLPRSDGHLAGSVFSVGADPASLVTTLEPAMGPHVAFVSTYPPRSLRDRHLTPDLAAVVATADRRRPLARRRILYPPKSPDSSRGTPTRISAEDTGHRPLLRADQVSAIRRVVRLDQHGVRPLRWPGRAFILDFLDRIRVPGRGDPAHGAARQPSASQRHVMTRLLDRSSAVVSHVADRGEVGWHMAE